MRALHYLLFTLVLASLVACGGKKDSTQIVVSVISDLKVPDDIDEVDIIAVSPDGTKMATAISGGSGLSTLILPAYVDVYRGASTSLGPFLVTATGKKNGIDVVTRNAMVSFVENEVLELRIQLLRSCEGHNCMTAGSTCVSGACASNLVSGLQAWGGPPDNLPVSTPDMGPIDMGPLDMGVRDLGPDMPILDAPMDGPFDMNTLDAPVDFGPIDMGVDMCAMNVEICNGVDDNCNMEVDETFHLDRDALNCGSCGHVCANDLNSGAAGTPACVASVCVIVPSSCPTGYSDCNGVFADGCEASLTSAQNCGECANLGGACMLTNATPVCNPTTLQCAIHACSPTTFSDCDTNPSNGCEVDTLTDSRHCGNCMNDCSAGVVHASSSCMMGMCQSTCDDGYLNCDNSMPGCESSILSATSCGGCGPDHICPTLTPYCVAADGGYECVSGCPTGQTLCNGSCVDTTSNPSFCGSCMGACTDEPNSAPTCTTSNCGYVCDTGFLDCDTVSSNGCEHTTHDTTTCGSCGNDCTAGAHVDPSGTSCSSGGVCQYACATSYGDCDVGVDGGVPGCETALLTTKTHCGSCANDCTVGTHVTSSSTTCSAGACHYSCQLGYAECDGLAPGCETHISQDTGNCGACGNNCATKGHVASASCMNSSCFINSCASGYTDCNMSAADGCEMHTDVDAMNCGTCGNDCTAAANATSGSTCVTGACHYACTANHLDCNAGAGCETDTRSATTCGSCSNNCMTKPHVVAASCGMGGVCAVTTCATGYADCDHDGSNGCEVDLTAPGNCGSCGNNCATKSHVSAATCSSMMCQVSTCTSGYFDCNGMGSDGCEVHPSDDPHHCGSTMGACSIDCTTDPHVASATCSSGACSYSCSGNYADCNSGTAGCETDLSATTSCGTSCGTKTDCTAKPHVVAVTCSSGSCGVTTCASGYADCDHDGSNGCEVDLNSAGNCGACGNSCSSKTQVSAATCSSMTCHVTTCNSGYFDCDTLGSNGCEVHPSNDAHNCGTTSAACGNDCTNDANVSSATCTSGACAYSCASGFGDCTGTAGCETPTTTASNCGACGNNCSTKSHVSAATCGLDALCHVTTCAAGFADCDGVGANGCEVDITLTANCGACGNNCASKSQVSAATCSGMTCHVTTCNSGYFDCDSTGSNGCEVHGTNDAQHCGNSVAACTNDCTNDANISSATCAAGTCSYACSGSFADCTAASGCETDLTLAASCGTTCGNKVDCSATKGPHVATAGCSIAHACTIGTCAAGYFDCNGDVADGCEVHAADDVNNCGSTMAACGNDCTAKAGVSSATCSSGVCHVTACTGSLADCDTNGANGCETDTDSSLMYCASCGHNCATDPHITSANACASGVCSYSCASGYSDCDSSAGCETHTDALTTDCGMCGHDCGMDAHVFSAAGCATGLCSYTCNTGFADCNMSGNDGCETNLTNVMSCGSTCGTVLDCTAGGTVSGMCCKNDGTCGILGMDCL